MWADRLTTRQLFFTGKGGVGKTSLACAAAVRLAESGRPTLIVSTDPASNLDQVFGVTLGPEPTAIPGVPNLWGANLDPNAAAAEYREKVVGPYRGKLPEAVVRNMEEQFSGACTTEIAAFDQFVRLLADPEATGHFQHVVFDTAPTGHTLRLLTLPTAWSGYLDTTTAEASCLGPLAGLEHQRELYKAALTALADPERTTVVLVARPEPASLHEAARTATELGELGVRNLRTVVNAVFETPTTDDPVARAYTRAVTDGLAGMPPALRATPVETVPLLPGNIVGLAAVRALLDPSEARSLPVDVEPLATGEPWDTLIDRLAADGHGVVMTMGKGGVGKTTVAVLIARSLAERGHRVLLTTTDPAGNLLDLAGDLPAGLETSQIDARREVEAYTNAVLAKAAPDLKEDALALLKEDLRSPCTEEIAVFRAFAEAVALGEDRFVVVDTAPTGHSILLMDATEAYHREVARTQSDAPDSVRRLLPRLRDPRYTKVVLVALPEPTPIEEARTLEVDLRRAGIEPTAWVVNRSLSLAGVTEPLLAAKAAREAEATRPVTEGTVPSTTLPWSPTPLATLAKR